ncbi:MAG: hypothetical protein ACMXYC_02500 [Candidatus Woesearchaeota archaeon]
MTKNIGVYAFTIGVVLAVLVSLGAALMGMQTAGWVVLVTAVMGIIAGLFNVTEKQLQMYLVASVAFLLSATALSTVVEVIPVVGVSAVVFLQLMIAFFAPQTALLAIRALIGIVRN